MKGPTVEKAVPRLSLVLATVTDRAVDAGTSHPGRHASGPCGLPLPA